MRRAARWDLEMLHGEEKTRMAAAGWFVSQNESLGSELQIYVRPLGGFGIWRERPQKKSIARGV
jgi:hypothetical protein